MTESPKRVELPQRDPSGKPHYLDICGKKWKRTMRALEDEKSMAIYRELLQRSNDRLSSSSQAESADQFCEEHPYSRKPMSRATTKWQVFSAGKWLELNKDVHQALKKQSIEWAEQVGQRIYAPYREGECPPFPSNVSVGGETVKNLPQQRTEKIYRWLPSQLKYRHTCVAPQSSRSQGLWIKDRDRADEFYFGGSLNLIWLDPAKWAKKAEGKPILQDQQWGGIDYFEIVKKGQPFHVVSRSLENVQAFLHAYEQISF